jgi:hypothetical protein
VANTAPFLVRPNVITATSNLRVQTDHFGRWSSRTGGNFLFNYDFLFAIKSGGVRCYGLDRIRWLSCVNSACSQDTQTDESCLVLTVAVHNVGFQLQAQQTP